MAIVATSHNDGPFMTTIFHDQCYHFIKRLFITNSLNDQHDDLINDQYYPFLKNNHLGYDDFLNYRL